jgi:hypothetical protein
MSSRSGSWLDTWSTFLSFRPTSLAAGPHEWKKAEYRITPLHRRLRRTVVTSDPCAESWLDAGSEFDFQENLVF